jgi:hypothetical protein
MTLIMQNLLKLGPDVLRVRAQSRYKTLSKNISRLSVSIRSVYVVVRDDVFGPQSTRFEGFKVN